MTIDCEVPVDIDYDQFAKLKDYSVVFHDAGGDITIFDVHYTVRNKLDHIKEKTETVDGLTKTYNYDYDPVGQLQKVYENSTNF